jgi:uncharacterized protein (DUF1800 family)
MNESPQRERPRKQTTGFKPTRRQVLAASGATMAGLVAARLAGLKQLTPGVTLPGESTATPTALPSASAVGTQDWISPLGKPDAQVAHLLRRATFGASQQEYQAAVKDGFAKTVERLIETPAAEPPVLAGADEANKDKPISPVALQSWWIDWMMKSPTPFAERMTFFWHGHFTSDYRKVTPQTPYIYWQNRTWRKIALAKFRDMLYAVTTDPGMLRYLDLAQSTGKSPNENYSRELMELFTMGVGTYTEDDVRAAAKGLAGWREPLTQALVDQAIKDAEARGRPAPRNLKADTVRVGIFEERNAYVGQVKYLGETRQWDTNAVLDKIVAQDSVAPFIVDKVASEFVSPSPDAAYVKRLADGFRKTKYDVKSLMRDVFTSPEFLAASSYRTLLKSPTELMVHAAKALGNTQLTQQMARAGDGMGQALFDPPEVGGWPSNASWISTNNVLARVNFALTTLSGMPNVPAFKDAHVTHLDGVVSAETAQLLNSASDDATRWLILLASPEFQLK